MVDNYSIDKAVEALQYQESQTCYEPAWTKVKPYSNDKMFYWFSGIYKIVTYGPRDYGPQVYHAYFIKDGCSNWGDNVGNPPSHSIGNGMSVTGWLSLEDAQAVCLKDKQTRKPSSRTSKRAAEILESYVNNMMGG